eukprot:471920_1
MFNIGGFDYSMQSDVDYATEEEQQIDLDSTQFRKEFEEALQSVRDVAKIDQEFLVNSICNICNNLADEEPDVTQLAEIFGAVKEGLVEEAREELELDNEDKESDTDYDVDEESNDYDVTEDTVDERHLMNIKSRPTIMDPSLAATLGFMQAQNAYKENIF